MIITETPREGHGHGPFKHCDLGLKSRSRHERVSMFFCVALSCVGVGSMNYESPVQGAAKNF
jgi:hypothetical protein